MTTETVAPPNMKAPLRIRSLREERLERILALAFGFMSFIPILLLWAVITYQAMDLSVAMYVIIGCALVGYFVFRRIMRSILVLARKARDIAQGQPSGRIDVEDHNEIGELARAFNRITQDLETKIEELESSRQLVKKLLARIGTAIISYQSIDNVLSLIVENTAGALESQLGSLLLLDGEKGELCLKTAWSSNGQTAAKDFRCKLGEGVAGWVVKENRAMRGPGSPAALGFAGGGREGAVLCVPLQLRERPIGVLAVAREDAARTFTDDDQSLMESIGSQMAVAIENYRLNMDVERTYVETIMALALAVEAKDPYSAGHSKRVGFYATKIGERLGLEEETLRTLNDAGVLHDIGKIGIKDEILLKAAPLSPDEDKVMQQHSVIGEAIVKPVRSLQKVVPLVRHHHERYDGSGYPAGLKGEAIPLGVRILAVADTYDAMVTDRPYRKRLPLEVAKAELVKNKGKLFDPAVVDAMLQVIAEREERQASRDGGSTPSPGPGLPLDSHT